MTHHYYNNSWRFNVEAMRREARKRSARGEESIIHMHKADEDCDDFDDHEVYLPKVEGE